MIPQLSIVLCTRNRADHLPAALDYYHRISASVPWELVVVNNGSTDDTSRILADLAASAGVSVRLVDEPIPGLSRARNAGWRAAQGEVIAFTDDDCYPAADFVDAVARNFSESSIGYLGGKILLFDPDDYPITIQLEDRHLTLPPGSFIPAGLIQGANMAVRRNVLEQLGGFDEMFGAGTPFPSEDVEFLSRASALGFPGAYDPRPVVSHHHRRRTGSQVAALVRSYDVGRGAYYMKCLLDPLRRLATGKEWYWRIRGNLRQIFRYPEGIFSNIREVRGALGYLRRRTWMRLCELGQRPQ